MPNENVTQKVNEAVEKLNQATLDHCCKRCGFDQTNDVVHPDPELLKKYFKAALSQSPFSHTYSLFDGALNVTFEEPSGNLLRLQELAAIHRSKEKESTISDAMDFAMLPTLALVTTNSAEEGTKVIYKASVERRTQLLEAFENPPELRNMPLVMLQAIRNTYSEFSQLCAQLVNEAQDKNFWKGAGRN